MMFFILKWLTMQDVACCPDYNKNECDMCIYEIQSMIQVYNTKTVSDKHQLMYVIFLSCRERHRFLLFTQHGRLLDGYNFLHKRKACGPPLKARIQRKLN